MLGVLMDVLVGLLVVLGAVLCDCYLLFLKQSVVISKVSLCLGPDSHNMAFSLGSSRWDCPSAAGCTEFQPSPRKWQGLSPKKPESLASPLIFQRTNNLHGQVLPHCIGSSCVVFAPPTNL